MAGQGFLTKAAYGLESLIYTPTWPSTAPVLGTTLLPLLSESVVPETEYETIEAVSRTPSAPRLVSRRSIGEVAVDARFSGIEPLFASAFGFMSPSLPEQLAAGVYRHLYELDDTVGARPWKAGEGVLSGSGITAGQRKRRRGTFTVEKGGITWQSHGCSVTGFALTANSTGVSFVFGLIGYDTIYTNGLLLDGLSKPEPRVLYQSMEFYLSESDTFSPADRIEDLTGFSLAFGNNLEADPDVQTGANIAEPEKSSESVPTGSFAMPVYNAKGDYLKEVSISGQLLRGLVVFNGNALDSTFARKMSFYLPEVYILSPDIVVQGDSLIQQTFSYSVTRPTAELTNFPQGYKNSALMVEIVTDDGGHPQL